MTAGPLPAPLPGSGAVVQRVIQAVIDDRIALQAALSEGCDEVLRVTSDGLVCEGARSNIFVVIGRRLWTPRADGPLLPGIMRQVVLEHAARLGIESIEAPLPLAQLAKTDEAFLTNSVRGVCPIARLMDRALAVPGPVTSHVWGAILPWLESGGMTP
jgi:branched-subunit amino acid aminotransferase/4-amino-4-deoxychorismate lyase